MRVSQSRSGKVWLDGSRVEKYGQVKLAQGKVDTFPKVSLLFFGSQKVFLMAPKKYFYGSQKLFMAPKSDDFGAG